MLTAREYLDKPSDNEKACELHILPDGISKKRSLMWVLFA